MKFECTEVFNFEGALRGMRNPKNSWKLSDSKYGFNEDYHKDMFCIGPKDMELCQTLIKGGSEHRKFLRQISVSVDITAPLFWWKEYATYKIGTTENSTSTMHKLAQTPITLECFEIEDYHPELLLEDSRGYTISVGNTFSTFIEFLETLRLKYLETKDKKYWKELIRLLPESWLQTRTCTMNYENILNMRHQRKTHKQTEWSVDFMNWSDKLPYIKDFESALTIN